MVKIECTEEQARLIMEACDLLARVGLGQFNAVPDVFRYCLDPRVEGKDEELRIAESIMNEAKRALFGLSPGSSFGIHSPKVPEKFRDSWMIKKVIAHAFWLKGGKKYHGVDSYPPTPMNETPLCKVEIQTGTGS